MTFQISLYSHRLPKRDCQSRLSPSRSRTPAVLPNLDLLRSLEFLHISFHSQDWPKAGQGSVVREDKTRSPRLEALAGITSLNGKNNTGSS